MADLSSLPPLEPDSTPSGPPEPAEAYPQPGMTYQVSGNTVLRDGDEHLITVEPEMALGMANLLNEAVAYDREARTHVMTKIRKARVVRLEDLIENPSRAVERMAVESPAHWAARAVMSEVDGWL